MPDFAFRAASITAHGPALWTPSLLTDRLALWLDAAHAASVPGPITRWADRSGQGYDAVQNNADLRPTWRHDPVRGRGMIRFEEQDMEVPNIGLAAELSAFWVMAPDARAASNAYPIYLFLDGANFSGQGRKPLIHGSSGDPDSLSTQIGNVEISHVTTPGVMQIGGIVSRVGQVESALNGATPVVQTHQTSLTASGASGRIGALTSLCEWCELIVVAGSISEVERQRVEGYLAHRWSCANLLPPSHPYAGAAP